MVGEGKLHSVECPYFLAFGLNTEGYSVSLRIQSKCGKMRTRIHPNTGTFYSVPTFVSQLFHDNHFTISSSSTENIGYLII